MHKYIYIIKLTKYIYIEKNYDILHWKIASRVVRIYGEIIFHVGIETLEILRDICTVVMHTHRIIFCRRCSLSDYITSLNAVS